MKDLKSPFYAYRYLVAEIGGQTSILHDVNKGKQELLGEHIEDLASPGKTEWIHKKKRYVFYGFQNSDKIRILKFVKESPGKLSVEGNLDIEFLDFKQAKFIYLIIYPELQIILVERNNTVFPNIETVVNLVEDNFNKYMGKFDYSVNLYPLPAPAKFWQHVESADKIYELSLELNAPNMPFEGHRKAIDVLKELKEGTNIEKVKFTLTNQDGFLQVAKNFLGSYVEYIKEIGGKYFLKFERNGIKETIATKDDVCRANILRKNKGEYFPKEIADIESKIEAIHVLKTRRDEEE